MEEYISESLNNHINNIKKYISECDMSKFGEEMKRAGIYSLITFSEKKLSDDEYWVFRKQIEQLSLNANNKCNCHKKI